MKKQNGSPLEFQNGAPIEFQNKTQKNYDEELRLKCISKALFIKKNGADPSASDVIRSANQIFNYIKTGKL
ncbi:hypothetical protein Phi19:3_gp023 [Cellulophaga phage phi19:3]|uniref:Uncharacterized protein n=1 Tax=Cellulophaga phage phi19:3 TaxID=1327971 RepID=R9ZYM8_9CAUD|nr:hypothetical protein Phi19:3_gp023 [Cellulophaga phage phi19:3]AGO47427.1 hypothetical protein Phi19:3_gp023 [Cellulophaga phage phi19:3]